MKRWALGIVPKWRPPARTQDALPVMCRHPPVLVSLSGIATTSSSATDLQSRSRSVVRTPLRHGQWSNSAAPGDGAQRHAARRRQRTLRDQRRRRPLYISRPGAATGRARGKCAHAPAGSGRPIAGHMHLCMQFSLSVQLMQYVNADLQMNPSFWCRVSDPEARRGSGRSWAASSVVALPYKLQSPGTRSSYN
eukprot:COSAG03_NODE_264_length_9700_cov_10.107176_4_plen_193_part_00